MALKICFKYVGGAQVWICCGRKVYIFSGKRFSLDGSCQIYVKLLYKKEIAHDVLYLTLLEIVA